ALCEQLGGSSQDAVQPLAASPLDGRLSRAHQRTAGAYQRRGAATSSSGAARAASSALTNAPNCIFASIDPGAADSGPRRGTAGCSASKRGAGLRRSAAAAGACPARNLADGPLELSFWESYD